MWGHAVSCLIARGRNECKGTLFPVQYRGSTQCGPCGGTLLLVNTLVTNFCNDLFLLISDAVCYSMLHNTFCLHDNSAAALIFTIHISFTSFHHSLRSAVRRSSFSISTSRIHSLHSESRIVLNLQSQWIFASSYHAQVLHWWSWRDPNTQSSPSASRGFVNDVHYSRRVRSNRRHSSSPFLIPVSYTHLTLPTIYSV